MPSYDQMSMSLGGMIEALEAADPDKVCPFGFREPHSYRGYYEDCAFKAALDVPVSDMLAAARKAVGATYGGWKGGEYTMSESSDVWVVSDYGNCGDAITEALMAWVLGEPIPTPPAWTLALIQRERES